MPSGTSIAGPAHVIDGDTLVIADVRIRLEGIDAPEQAQTCGKGWFGGWGTWACGHEATEHLARLVREREVRCDSHGTDAYGRVLGVCFTAGLEINADMVRNGMAWAFVKHSQRYVEVEAEARALKLGIWRGEAKPAWQWRAEKWSAAEQSRPGDGVDGCVIKGNVTSAGQIYHTPWSPWYAKTRIDERRGERWFCSEAEAQAAGWRPAILR